MNNILNYYGKQNTAYIHARGKVATLLLTERLSPEADEKILEIGFGTGGTLTRLSVLFPHSEFFGVEVSEIMYQKASSRFKFSGLSKLPEIKLMKGATSLPFPDNSMDKVFAESVLAIQEGDSLPYVISEIRRVLKPGGICLLNETVWLQNLTLEEIININEKCKKVFGIILSNSQFPYAESWKLLFEDASFKVRDLEKIDAMKIKDSDEKLNSRLIRSNLFSFFGKFRALFDPKMRSEKNRIETEMNSFFKDQQHLEGILISAQKL